MSACCNRVGQVLILETQVMGPAPHRVRTLGLPNLHDICLGTIIKCVWRRAVGLFGSVYSTWAIMIWVFWVSNLF